MLSCTQLKIYSWSSKIGFEIKICYKIMDVLKYSKIIVISSNRINITHLFFIIINNKNWKHQVKHLKSKTFMM